ncbi:alpha/beta fold hydrolase, partial [Frisingicoccus sp.]|uniref:alpha/beta fold hydrolase n=1 Tax=Frisingicoccus sp. TaxID=1918627 RepID=UPI003AB65B0F
MVRKHGKEPYNIVVLHGGPGAAGSAFGLARLISKEFGVLEPMQSKYTIGELEEELMEQIEENCSGEVILAGHSWGAWLAGLFAERFPDKVEKVILIKNSKFLKPLILQGISPAQCSVFMYFPLFLPLRAETRES